MRGAVNLVIHILVDGCDDAVALQEEFSGYPPAMPWLSASRLLPWPRLFHPFRQASPSQTRGKSQSLRFKDNVRSNPGYTYESARRSRPGRNNEGGYIGRQGQPERKPDQRTGYHPCKRTEYRQT